MYTLYVNIKYKRVNILWLNKDQLFLFVHLLEVSFERYNMLFHFIYVTVACEMLK